MDRSDAARSPTGQQYALALSGLWLNRADSGRSPIPDAGPGVAARSASSAINWPCDSKRSPRFVDDVRTYSAARIAQRQARANKTSSVDGGGQTAADAVSSPSVLESHRCDIAHLLGILNFCSVKVLSLPHDRV